MSSQAVTRAKLQELLKCPLCLDTYKSPMAFTCLHTFCSDCVTNSVRSVQKGESQGYNCPCCWTFSAKPDVKPNFHMGQLLELYDESTAEKTCAGCKKAEAAWKCTDCCEYLCTPCEEIHMNLRALRNHVVVRVEELKDHLVLDGPVHCTKHPDETLKFNCKQCGTLLCTTCVLIEHKSHDYETVADALPRVTRVIERQVENLKTDKTNRQKALVALAQAEAKVNEDTEKSLQEATTIRDKWLAEINDHFKVIELELNSRKQHNLETIKCEMTKCENACSEIDIAVKSTENAFQTAKDVCLLNEVQSSLAPAMSRLEASTKTPWHPPALKSLKFKAEPSASVTQDKLGRIVPQTDQWPDFNQQTHVATGKQRVCRHCGQHDFMKAKQNVEKHRFYCRVCGTYAN